MDVKVKNIDSIFIEQDFYLNKFITNTTTHLNMNVYMILILEISLITKQLI